jgi:trehalose/maltose hydrolase-like predicted phosphorylase
VQRVAERVLSEWQLRYESWSADEQPLREALCALGNGLFVTRGAFEEANAGGPHCPGTYIAGAYNRAETAIAGRLVENEDLVNFPNWLPLTFRPEDGDWLALDSVQLLEFAVELDVYHGVLERRLRFRDAGNRESLLVSRRIVHMREPHLAAIEWTLTPENWSGTVEIGSGLDGSVRNENVARYREFENRHLEVLETGHHADDTIFLTATTRQSRIRVAEAARTRVFSGSGDDDTIPTSRTVHVHGDRIEHRIVVPVEMQKALRVEKIVALRTSRDRAISEPQTAALKDVRRAPTFAELLRSHELAWRQLWSVADIVLDDGDTETQLILRLHIFHLLQTVSHNSTGRDIGVPARGWHGEAYRGHIFWDELFIFPFLSLRLPELTRSLLLYRYHRLDEARHLARAAGFRGAMFPWQSGSDGREESQKVHLNPVSGRWVPDISSLQRHVNAAIAYNVWRYYEATNDKAFMAAHGAEMLVEIARFWASSATYDIELDHYEIRGVMGPDEFHTAYPDAAEGGLNNNAYTNVMASWVLRCARRGLDLLDEERRAGLAEELELADDELIRWDDVSRKLYIPFHGDGIISQFEGYDQLEEFDWQGYREKYGDIQRLDRLLEADDDDVNRYKASKQADVLMLFYLFSRNELREQLEHMRYTLDDELIPRNIDYYMQRTSHGSTLSRIVHYWVLARTDRERDWSLFRTALRSDIDDIQGGTTHEGIHLGAMAGTVDLMQRCHTGLELRGNVLWLKPQLPRELAGMRMRIRYHDHWLTLYVNHETLSVAVDRSESPAACIGFDGSVHALQPGEKREFRLRQP